MAVRDRSGKLIVQGLFERSRMLEPGNGQTVPPRDGRIMGLLQGKQKWANTTMTGYDYW